jgi:hypothetical protein
METDPNGWHFPWQLFLSELIGTAALLFCGALARRIEVAKLYHFESDRRRLFHRMADSN